MGTATVPEATLDVIRRLAKLYPNKWLRAREWASHIMALNSGQDLFSPGQREKPNQEAATGRLLTSLEGQRFVHGERYVAVDKRRFRKNGAEAKVYYRLRTEERRIAM